MSDFAPTWAERARTALADAGVATLVTSACPDPCTSTMVTIEDHFAGRPRVWLEPSSPVIAMVARSPLATIVVPGPSPFRCLALGGSLRPCDPDQSGCQPFEMSLRFVRLLGSAVRPIPVQMFLDASPDPLRGNAFAALDHLDKAHRAELLECVRAHGHSDVVDVVPRELDCYGIQIAAIAPSGVRTIRMNFRQGKVTTLEDVSMDLRIFLNCRCG